MQQISEPLHLEQALAEARHLSEVALADTMIMPAPVVSGFYTHPIDGSVSLAINNPFERLMVLVEAGVERFYERERCEPAAILLKQDRTNEVLPFRFYYSKRGARINYYQEDTASFDVCVKGAIHE